MTTAPAGTVTAALADAVWWVTRHALERWCERCWRGGSRERLPHPDTDASRRPSVVAARRGEGGARVVWSAPVVAGVSRGGARSRCTVAVRYALREGVARPIVPITAAYGRFP